MKRKIIGFACLLPLIFSPTGGEAYQGDQVLNVIQESKSMPLGINSISTLPYLKLFLPAEGGNVLVTELKIRRSGHSAYTDFERVWVSFDGKRSQISRILHDDTVSIKFKKPVLLEREETKVMQFYANSNAGGREHKKV